jgi:hypothetical protein
MPLRRSRSLVVAACAASPSPRAPLHLRRVRRFTFAAASTHIGTTRLFVQMMCLIGNVSSARLGYSLSCSRKDLIFRTVVAHALGTDSRPRQDNPAREGAGSPGAAASGGPGGAAGGVIPAGFAGRVNLIIPLATLLDLADRPGEISGRRDLLVTLDPIATDECDHRFEAMGHDPGVKLRHLSQIRHATCTGPGCRRPSTLLAMKLFAARAEIDADDILLYRQLGCTGRTAGASKLEHDMQA